MIKFLLRLGVVAVCVVITLYQGYQCTRKYMNQPESIELKIKNIESLPTLQYSVCKRFWIRECTVSSLSQSMSAADYYYYYGYEKENECKYEIGEMPNFASSYEDFWKDLVLWNEHKLSSFIREISLWNVDENNWETLYKYSQNETKLFRMAHITKA